MPHPRQFAVLQPRSHDQSHSWLGEDLSWFRDDVRCAAIQMTSSLQPLDVDMRLE